MKKIFTIFFVFAQLSAACSAFASSTIDIPILNNGTIAANSAMEMSFNSLPNDVPYVVTCQLDSASPTQLDMSFLPRLAQNSGFGVEKLNDKPILKHVGTLQNGQNTLSFLISVMEDKKNTLNALTLKNLDNRFSVSVKACKAEPATNVTSAAHRIAGGYFYITNHLPYYVDVSVGSFSPTYYCLYPHAKNYIQVSTAYQDIEIIGTHY